MKLAEMGIFTPEFLNGLPKKGRIPQEETTPLASTLVDGLEKALLGTPEFLVELGKTFFKDSAGLISVFDLSFKRGEVRFQMSGYIRPQVSNFSLTGYAGEDETIQRQIILSAIRQDSSSTAKVGNIGFVEHHKDEKGHMLLPNTHAPEYEPPDNTYEAVQGILKVIEDLNPQSNI